MTTPDVSLVMPARDVPADWLRTAVASALAEPDCNVELVVVDDGSATPVEAVLERDHRLQVVRADGVGPYRARDIGSTIAAGAVLRYVDADDVVAPGSTGRLLALLEGRADVVAYGQTAVADEVLRPVDEIRCDLEGHVAHACLQGRFTVRVVSMVFPRPVAVAAGPWDAGFEISGDWDWVLRAVEHATVRHDPAAATTYRRHAGSLTVTASVRSGEAARCRIIDRYLDRHPAERGTTIERDARLALHVDRALAYAGVGDMRSALARTARAARLSPRAGVGTAARVIRIGIGRRRRRRRRLSAP